MSYTGNAPAEQYITTVKDTFNGDNSTTDFTLSRPALANNLEVFVEHVQQEPTTAYTVSGTTISFTSAPPTGTGNIYVIHRGQAVQTIVPPAGISVNATDLTVTGASALQDGLTVDNDGATVATFDRATSDGDIIDLQKDGSSVGSVGVDGGDNLYLTGESGNTGGIYMNDAAVSPAYQGAERDNYYNLGKAPARWKDLYLSGGVYLGGTGAANKLDDYEEGTWTPVGYTGNSSGFNPTVTAFWGGTPNYVKVGGLVHVQAGLYFGNSSGSVTVGDFVVIDASSFPFTPISQPSSSGSFYAYNTNYAHVSCHMQTDGRVYLYVHTVVGNPLRVGGAFALGITYKTNS